MNWKKFLIKEKSTINNVAQYLNNHGLKILFVVNSNYELLGTVTDGDIRRGFLNGCKLSDKVEKILNTKFSFIKKGSYLKNNVYKMMKKKNINHLPVLKNKKIINLYFFENSLINSIKIQNDFIILAGGFGKRLHPLTKNIPKPMIIVKNKPILEHIILSARNEGFYNFQIIVHYLKDKIKNYFQDGSKFGVNIKYIEENLPLGTAGGLSLLKKKISKNFIVTNADILSNICYKDLLENHIKNKSKVTVGIKVTNSKQNYGLVKLKGINIVRFEEKPILHKFINCGVYAFDKEVLKKLTINKNIDMITFLKKLKKNNTKIRAFAVYESWLDLGTKKNLNKYIQ
jgi:dTDP-glucose pyrophosphorylase/predicted transcriptional regulator